MAVGAARPAIHHRQPTWRQRQYRHGVGRAIPARGYTLVMVATSSAVNATLFENHPFNFLRDIAPVGSISRAALVMEVHPSVPVATGLELIAYAKANPNKLNMRSEERRVGKKCTSRGERRTRQQ